MRLSLALIGLLLTGCAETHPRLHNFLMNGSRVNWTPSYSQPPQPRTQVVCRERGQYLVCE